jgi:excisionase family DNA binding protein
MKKRQGNPYLTIEETAATLRVSERTVRRWIARGIVEARRIGGTVRVPREVVAEGKALAGRPPKGRPAKERVGVVAGLSEESFARTWDNPEDAAYDRWREIYGVRKR